MRKKKIFLVILVLMSLIFSFGSTLVSAGELQNDNSSTFIPPIGILVGIDENGETTSASVAAIFSVDEGDALAFSGLGAFSDNATSYMWGSFADGATYVAELGQVYEPLGLLGWYVSDAASNPSALSMANTYEGERSTLIYLNDALEFYSANVVSLDMDMIEENPIVTLEGIPSSDIMFPAVVINDEGYCTGIVYDSSTMYAVVTTEDNFYISDHGSTDDGPSPEPLRDTSGKTPSEIGMYVLMVAVVIVIVVLIIIFTRKNGRINPMVKTTVAQQEYKEQYVATVPPTMPVAQSLSLYGTSGPLEGCAYPLVENNQEILIGRDASTCNLHFPADTKGVSRIHCKLYWSNGLLMLMDLNSSYGTFKENEKLMPMQPINLKAGDTFYLAEKTNQFKVQ